MTSHRADHQADAFDLLADRYDDTYPHKSGQIIATQWLLDRIPPAARVLDLGCGTGLPTAEMLTEAGHHVVGIDVSTAMLTRARRAVPAGTFLQQDMRDLADSLGVFDAAAAFHSQSLLPLAEISNVLQKLRAVLRPGAPVAIGIVHGDLDDAPQQLHPRRVHVAAHPIANLVSAVHGAGLEITEVDVEDYQPPAEAPPEQHVDLYCRDPAPSVSSAAQTRPGPPPGTPPAAGPASGWRRTRGGGAR